MGVSFGSQIDEKGCKLTSSRVAICQSFSHLCGVHINHRGPLQTVILRANSVVISHAITQIAQWDPRTQWSCKSSPPHSVPFSFPFLPSFWDEERNAPQRVTFFSSGGNWESRRGPLWCYFPFRVGRRCLVAQLKMIIWKPVKQGSPLEPEEILYVESQGPK